MEDEDDRAKKHAGYQLGQELADLSVDELSEIIDLLEMDIERLETAKREKAGHISAAEALFKR